MTVVAQPAPSGYDVVVVGAGPAGLTVARKLEALTDLRVLIVESGGENVGVAQELAKVEAEGDFAAPYFALHSQRVFGGTSNIWRGWCAVLDERPFLANEWPFPYAELYRHYPEAARILNVPPVVHERPEAAFDGTGGSVVYRPWYFSDPVRFGWDGEALAGARHGAGDWVRDSTAVDVLLDHTAMRMVARDAVVEGVSLVRSNADAKPFRVAAGCIVLAAGAIQNARLLWLSLGEDSPPALGRYFAEHPHLYDFAHLEIDRAAAESVMDLSRPSFEPAPSRVTRVTSVAHGIGLSASFSNEHAVLSATVEFTPWPVQALLAGRRRPAFGSNAYIRAEMASPESNRVELSNTQVDFLGQPRARVAMALDFAAAKEAAGLLNAELVRTGIGRLQLSGDEPVYARPSEGMPLFTGGGHLMGTTRMGTDPRRSVTDAAGKVHGFSNLYVAGSSLFPASSAGNPTLTIVALALRLAEHLAAQANTSRRWWKLATWRDSR